MHMPEPVLLADVTSIAYVHAVVLDTQVDLLQPCVSNATTALVIRWWQLSE